MVHCCVYYIYIFLYVCTLWIHGESCIRKDISYGIGWGSDIQQPPLVPLTNRVLAEIERVSFEKEKEGNAFGDNERREK